MYLRLLCDLPLDERHGAITGRVFQCLRHDNTGRHAKAWFRSDAGEECAAFKMNECELYDSREAAAAAGGEDETSV